jgi:hypothetical protein
MAAKRWIVDTDGLGSWAIAQERETGGLVVSEPMPLDRAERALKRMNERDAAELHASRVESGRRLSQLRGAGL